MSAIRLFMSMMHLVVGGTSLSGTGTTDPAIGEPAELAPSYCYPPNPLLYHFGNVCFNSPMIEFDPIHLPLTRGGNSLTPGCGVLDNFYVNSRFSHSFSNQISDLQPIPSPPAPGVYHRTPSDSGIPDLVSIPCKPCETDRKDRKFIRGVPYKNSMTKLLVDHASGQSGGKILAHADSLRGVSDIIHSDDSRYMLTACSNKVWFTIKLADEVFIEKVGITASELFASTFRHIQILGSKQYPTSEWRVLGEVETNPIENQEWFDLSGSSQCSKCYVKYLKFRVLTHHTLEGYTKCALTRIQVFGSTVLQSLDKIQAMSNTTDSGTASKTPGFFVRTPDQLFEFFDPKLKTILGTEYNENIRTIETDQTSTKSTTDSPPLPEQPSPPLPPEEPPSSDENFPLLKFIEEMTSLKKQYAAVSSNLHALQDAINGKANSTISVKTLAPDTERVTTPPPQSMVSVFGVTFQAPNVSVETVVAVLVCIQFIVIISLLKTNSTTRTESAIHVQPIRIQTREPHSGFSRRKPASVLRPKVRRSISFMHYMKELKKHTVAPIDTPHLPDRSFSTLIDEDSSLLNHVGSN